MNPQKDFFFISYNHRNEEVLEDTSFFDSSYANYWIDNEKMRATDNSWIERVERTTANEHCKGAVFYLSTDSLSSDAVETEIAIVQRIRETRPDFFVFAVLIGGISIPHLIKKTYMSVEDSELVRTLPLSRIVKISTLFSDEKIYLVRDPHNLESYRKQIMTNLFESGVVLNQESIENELKKNKKIDAYNRYQFGRFYKQEIVSNVYIAHTNEISERNGTSYIKLEDGTVRPVEPIKWIILDYDDGKMRLISESVLETITGNVIDRWLNGFFLDIAFSAEEREKLTAPVSTLTYEEYNHYNENNDINPTNGSFWLNSINKRNQTNMFMYVNGVKVNTIGSPKHLKNGIRPVIEISVEKM